MTSDDLVFALQGVGFTRFCGVPDSILADFSDSLDAIVGEDSHVVCANEGSAVAQAMGIYLATKCVPVVYMQNSGLGNAVNPLISMASSAVVGIPLLLIIGWRGQPGVPDEPQHLHQGIITLPLLELLDINYKILNSTEPVSQQLSGTYQACMDTAKPTALVIPRGVLATKPLVAVSQQGSPSRRDYIETLVEVAPGSAAFVSTTGFASRELNEILIKHSRSGSGFYVVGAMGYASQIGYGISSQLSERHVVCIDGDGALLMHAGGLASQQHVTKRRFIHILINNGCHDSVGGQRTAKSDISYTELATIMGYKQTKYASSIEAFKDVVLQAFRSEEPTFIEVKVQPGSFGNLSRPSQSPKANAIDFMVHLSSTSI